MISQTKYILGLGSPLLDLQAEVDAAFLQKYGLSLNNTYFATEAMYPLYDELLKMPDFHSVPGGSSLNTIRMSQWMLQQDKNSVKFVGCVGEDVYAKMLIEETLRDGVDPVFEVNTTEQTGKCAVLLSQKDRCLVPVIGAAGHFSETFAQGKMDLFVGATILFSEVYFLFAKADIMLKLYQLASDNGAKVCLTLSSQNAVTDMFDHIQKLWPYVDVVFGNEEEFKQLGINHGFTDTDLGVVAQKLAKLDKAGNGRERVCVVTRGKDSTIVSTPNEIHDFPLQYTVPVEEIVDANAAGDSFAGGFISQLLNTDDYKQCVLGGQYAAAQCIKQPGSSLPPYKPEFKA